MPRSIVSLIAAVARNGGIGKDNALLVRLPEDLAHFKRTTLGSPVVMGRKTWESIGRPLPGRRNVVVTRNPAFSAPGAEVVASLDAAFEQLAHAERVYIIGGASIYAAALPRADELVLTEIDAELDADTFFPQWNRSDFSADAGATHRSAQGVDYRITTYVRRQGNEHGAEASNQ